MSNMNRPTQSLLANLGTDGLRLEAKRQMREGTVGVFPPEEMLALLDYVELTEEARSKIEAKWNDAVRAAARDRDAMARAVKRAEGERSERLRLERALREISRLQSSVPDSRIYEIVQDLGIVA